MMFDNDGYDCRDIDDNDDKDDKPLLRSVQSAGVLWSSDTLVEFTSNESGFRCPAQKPSLLSHKSWHCLITFNKYTSSSLKVGQICWPEKNPVKPFEYQPRPGTKTNASMHCFTAKSFAPVGRTKVRKNQNKLASNHTNFDRKILVLRQYWSTPEKLGLLLKNLINRTKGHLERNGVHQFEGCVRQILINDCPKEKKRSDHWSRKEKLLCSGTQQIHFFAPGVLPIAIFRGASFLHPLIGYLCILLCHASNQCKLFLIGRLADIESRLCVLDIFRAAK